MAPTATTNTSIPLQTGREFGGDEFSNNLFSDLAPLLTLFGEQVTKQFLSMSMGWADDVLLAMGPLGIMTVIVSAIRVGGIKTLKAFVGRARESRANAEKEILSSTSEDVCELWSGREIVRELGNPEGMRDIILLDEEVEINIASGTRWHQKKTRILDIDSAVDKRIVTTPDQLAPNDLSNISNGAPNIALNVRNATASQTELLAWAVFGTILQLSALAFPAVTTYHMGWKKSGSDIAGYGYPCFATGTIAVAIGMILCGRVIEGSTTENDFQLSRRYPRAQIMRLQKACTVSDQNFPAYAIFNSPTNLTLRTSRLNSNSFSRTAAVATLVAVLGFVIQFVGLRALHWSATIYQLGVMVIMTMVRSLVRRGLAADPIFYPLLDGHELAWLTLYMISTNALRIMMGSQSREADPEQRMLEGIVRLEPLTGYFGVHDVRTSIDTITLMHRCTDTVRSILNIEDSRLARAFQPLLDQRALDSDDTISCNTCFVHICRDLQRLTPISSAADDTAASLALAIERIMSLVVKSDNILWDNEQGPFIPQGNELPQVDRFSFNAHMVRGKYLPGDTATLENLPLSVEMVNSDTNTILGNKARHDTTWKTDRGVLSSIITLWLFSLELRRSAARKLAAVSHRLQTQNLAPEGGSNLLIHRNVYFRIVAATPLPDENDEQIRQSSNIQCIRWLDAEVYNVPLFGDYNQREMTDTNTDNLELLANLWVAWGLKFSMPFGSTRRDDKHENAAVLTRPETPIAGQCALELFSYFMEAVAARIDKLGGTTVRIDRNSTQGPFPLLSNSVINSIANECVAVGLAHDVDEANTVIIPAFVKHDLLPKKPHGEIKWQRDEVGILR